MAWVDIYDRHSTYGFAPSTWDAAKTAAKQLIVHNLRNPGAVVTTYGDLVGALTPIIDFGTPRNAVFHCLLGQISDEEEEHGRGLLSALVVHKEDLRPGSGFYGGAAKWGRDVTNETACWNAELQHLQRQWT
jgi:hypothetical protein